MYYIFFLKARVAEMERTYAHRYHVPASNPGPSTAETAGYNWAEQPGSNVLHIQVSKSLQSFDYTNIIFFFEEL